MLNIKDIVDKSEEKYIQRIEYAKQHHNGNTYRIIRRENELYSIRLVRHCLNLNNKIDLNKYHMALCVALPEFLFAGMYTITWKNYKHTYTYPMLLKEYSDSFKSINTGNVDDIIKKIINKNITSSLICHGLSTTPDSIFLLADIGKTVRISYALKITKIKALLADDVWAMYNRSFRQAYKSKDEFIHKLKNCINYRLSLYNKLGISTTGYDKKRTCSNVNLFIDFINILQEKAKKLWGNGCLEKQDIKRKIDIARYCSSDHDEEDNAIISLLKNISDMFSSYSKEVIFYFLSQFIGQESYDNYVKIAIASEKKFDDSFLNNELILRRYLHLNKLNYPNKNRGFIYYPWYVMSENKVLPYTTYSGDVIKKYKNEPIEHIIPNKLILLDNKLVSMENIIAILKKMHITHRNRLISDILSFIHFFSWRFRLSDSLLGVLNDVSPDISIQIESHEDQGESYNEIFSNWILSISKKYSVTPFHIIPYLWEDKDWNNILYQNCAKILLYTINTVNEILYN